MAKAAEIGADFLDRLAARLPEDKRAGFKEFLTGTPEVLEELGQGVLRHEDYSKVRDLQTKWWDTNSQKVTEYDRLKASGSLREGDPQPTEAERAAAAAAADPNKRPVTLEEGRALERDSLRLNAIISGIATSHFHEFSEPLNTLEIVDKALAAGRPIQEFYDESVKERRQKRDTENRAKELKDAEERGKQAGREEAMRSMDGKTMPYPVGSSAPTTLAGLRPPDDAAKAQHTVDAAVATLIGEMNKQGASV